MMAALTAAMRIASAGRRLRAALVAALVSCPAAAPTAAPDPLAALFDAARGAASADGLDLGRYAALRQAPTEPDAAALWPLQAFWLAEAHARRGDTQRSLGIHRAIVAWAADDPYRDGSGGSALAAVSLWKLLARPGGPAGEAVSADRALFDLGWRYWQHQGSLAHGLFDATPVLGALPQLREALLAQLATLAWASDARGEAHALLAEYLTAARSDVFSPTLQRIFDDAVARNAIAREPSLLALAKRLDQLGKTEPAHRLFEALRDAANADVAGDARLQLARDLRDADGRLCAGAALQAEIDKVLARALAPELRQRALLFRARRALQSGCTPDLRGFERDLAQLVGETPHARATFDAWFAIAEFHLDRYLASGDAAAFERALERYGRARAMAGSGAESFLNNPSARTLELVGAAWLKPALWLAARGRPADRRDALALLDELLARWPAGPLRLAAGFWRGRLLAEAGATQQATEQFRSLVADSPYDYHALRARLRLRAPARSATGIALDPATRAELGEAHAQAARRIAPPLERSPLHLRLRAALDSRSYEAALGALFALRREVFPGRLLEDIGLEELEQSGKLTVVATALALRQDARLAAGRPASTDNRMAVARAISSWPSPDWLRGDWPLAVTLVAVRTTPGSPKPTPQQHADYLPVAYPHAYVEQIQGGAAQSSVPAELLYAVIRTETVFNPSAESQRAALGLFQFIPPTFDALNRRWKLVAPGDRRAAEVFLLSPQTNIALGARWFREELLPREEGNILFALMAHNAGPRAVQRWKAVWARFGRLDDTEFVVDTLPFEETRGFVRRALPALWIAGATTYPNPEGISVWPPSDHDPLAASRAKTAR